MNHLRRFTAERKLGPVTTKIWCEGKEIRVAQLDAFSDYGVGKIMDNVELIEKKLQELINQNNLGGILTVEMIKDLIWHEEDDKAFNGFVQKTLGYFNDIKDIDELNRILQIFNDAWNYFPHKCLDGKSPMQAVGESKK